LLFDGCLYKIHKLNTNNSAGNGDSVWYDIITVVKCECLSWRSCNAPTHNEQYKLCSYRHKTHSMELWYKNCRQRDKQQIRITEIVSSVNQLTVPLFKLSTGLNGLFQFLAPTSGSLPLYMTSAQSLAIFRQHLKTFLFCFSYPDLVLSNLLPTSFYCRPNDNFCYSGLTKNPNDDDHDDQ